MSNSYGEISVKLLSMTSFKLLLSQFDVSFDPYLINLYTCIFVFFRKLFLHNFHFLIWKCQQNKDHTQLSFRLDQLDKTEPQESEKGSCSLLEYSFIKRTTTIWQELILHFTCMMMTFIKASI